MEYMEGDTFILGDGGERFPREYKDLSTWREVPWTIEEQSVISLCLLALLEGPLQNSEPLRTQSKLLEQRGYSHRLLKLRARVKLATQVCAIMARTERVELTSCVSYISFWFQSKSCWEEKLSLQKRQVKCDGFFGASNLTDHSIGAINLLHEGPEEQCELVSSVKNACSLVHTVH